MEEGRKTTALPLQHPVLLKVREGLNWREVRGPSENASERGVLLLADSAVPQGTEVELTLMLQKEAAPGVRLFCPGRVVRVEQEMDGSRIAVAVECLRQLEG